MKKPYKIEYPFTLKWEKPSGATRPLIYKVFRVTFGTEDEDEKSEFLLKTTRNLKLENILKHPSTPNHSPTSFKVQAYTTCAKSHSLGGPFSSPLTVCDTRSLPPTTLFSVKNKVSKNGNF